MTAARRFPNNPGRQRGAIGLWGILTLMLAVLFTALSVDSGRLWMQHRNLQTVADIAAMDAAQSMGCAASASDVADAANAAAARNGYAGDLSAAPNAVELGTVTTNGGIRQFAAGGNEAVRVYATRSVPASLVAGGLFGGTVLLNAEAVAGASTPIAAFSGGTFAASVDTDDMALANSLLGGMLGTGVNLSVLSYQGIAATSITLLDLVNASGQAGGVDALLNTSMQLGDLLDLMATAVNNSTTASAEAKAGMQTLATAAASHAASLTLADVLDVTTPDPDAAAKVGVNAFSLLMTSVLVANGSNAISMPLTVVSVPGIASVNAQVSVIEAPQLAIGPPGLDGNGAYCTSMTTAQVRAKAWVNVSILGLAKVDLMLDTQIANGSAGLDSVSDDGSDSAVQITATPGVASFDLTNSAGSAPARISTLLNIPIATLGIDLPIQSSAQPLAFSVAHPVTDNLPQVQTVSSPVGGSLENALEQPGTLDVTVLSLLNTALVNTVVSTVVTPLLGEIGRVLLDPLLNLLGIRVGGMDVTLEGVALQQQKPLLI